MSEPLKDIGPKIETTLLNQWLVETRTENPGHKYTHILFKENELDRKKIVIGLATYFNAAHEPARKRLRAPFKDSLHPLKPGTRSDPATGYPEALHINTLKGYFGELFTGIIAASYEHFGSTKWEVPVYLFHVHDVAFQQLELAKQTGDSVPHVPGRTGNDCLAFERKEDGSIKRVMFCESKCTKGHHIGLIRDNFRKLSKSNLVPVDILRTIEALKFLPENKKSQGWIVDLQNLYFGDTLLNERTDLSCYVCGDFPKRTPTRISTKEPPAEYTRGRKIAAIEAHISDVEELVKSIYGLLGTSE